MILVKKNKKESASFNVNYGCQLWYFASSSNFKLEERFSLGFRILVAFFFDTQVKKYIIYNNYSKYKKRKKYDPIY